MARVVGVGMVVACAVACGGPDVAFSQSDTVAVAGSDSAVTAAAAALNAGRPWRATRLVAPALADSTRRTPEALFVAARAAAGWGGWARVDSLLAGASWVDSLFGGRARVLLAEAALARRADTAALAHARAAAAEATTDAERGVGLVLLARALDRLDQRDSARAAYVAASELLPPASDWLRLRAAGVTADPGVRRADYGRVADTAARARIAWTEAYARERTGDIAGAATVFDSLGARAAGFRLRIAASRDSAPRQALRDELVRYVEAQAGSPEGRTAVEVLDAAFDTLTASEQLAVGRALARGGPAARSATGFAAALRGGASLAPGDRFAYGQLLIRLDRDREAAAQLALVPASSPQAADAAYQRARALVGAGRAGE
ncbi:MAG TPA: hypothetical protein VNA89_04130, partial [Gemmatimonadaceae bacterium]|nr:hypothetical protein [Gemmatimonadaceae bacterium]